MGENDIESNLVEIKNFYDGGVLVESEAFLLPADSWKDFGMLDWVLSASSS